MQKKIIGKFDNKDIIEYKISNCKGLEAEILNYGARVKSVKFFERECVLSYADVNDYRNDGYYMGSAVGPNANRIKNGTFEINGQKFQLEKNDHGNSVHSGSVTFSFRFWDVDEQASTDSSLVLKISNKDGDGGFPGNLTETLTYSITDDNVLRIEYKAISDKDTLFNPTNHSYFNLEPSNSDSVYDELLMLNCDYYTPADENVMVYDKKESVKGTMYDFSTPIRFGTHVEKEAPKLFYDTNFIIRGNGFRHIATLLSADKTIEMQTYSDMPCLQIYTAGVTFDKSNPQPKNLYNAMCLETQFCPNAINFEDFDKPILKANEESKTVTEYRFIKH